MAQKTIILATIGVTFLGSSAFMASSALAETYQAYDVISTTMPAQCHAAEIIQGVPGMFAEGAEIIQPVLVERIEPVFQSRSDISNTGPDSGPIECATFVYSVSVTGAVDNIELIYYSEDRDITDTFIVAAEEALSQWQFEPGQVDQELQAFMGYSVAFYTTGSTPIRTSYTEHAPEVGLMHHHPEVGGVEVGGVEAGYLDRLESQILANDVVDGVTPEPVFLEDQVSAFVAAMVSDERVEPVSTISTPLSNILSAGSIRPVIDPDAMSVITETVETDIPFPSLFAE